MNHIWRTWRCSTLMNFYRYLQHWTSGRKQIVRYSEQPRLNFLQSSKPNLHCPAQCSFQSCQWSFYCCLRAFKNNSRHFFSKREISTESKYNQICLIWEHKSLPATQWYCPSVNWQLIHIDHLGHHSLSHSIFTSSRRSNTPFSRYFVLVSLIELELLLIQVSLLVQLLEHFTEKVNYRVIIA